MRAALSSSTGYPAIAAISGMLRVSGSQEWDHNGRSSLAVDDWATASPSSLTGWAVAVEERTVSNGGDLVVVGARRDPVVKADGTVVSRAGAVDVYENGVFITRLVSPTPVANASFGEVVAVASNTIVVGAPSETYEITIPSGKMTNDSPPKTVTTTHTNRFGAVYIFEKDGDGDWAQKAKLTVGFPTTGCTTVSKWAVNAAGTLLSNLDGGPQGFGQGVSISDDGSTIVATKGPTAWTCTGGNENTYAASAHVFSKGSGWADANTGQTAVRPLWYKNPSGFNPYGAFTIGTAPGDVEDYDQSQRRHIKGDVAISGDGSTIAVGGLTFPRLRNGFDLDVVQWRRLNGNRGMVLVYNRPGATNSTWTTASTLLQQNALLIVAGTRKVQLSKKLAISNDGGVIVSTGSGEYWDQTRTDGGLHNHTAFPGQAYVWVKPSGGWDNAATETARLYSATAANGDLYGSAVAISDDGQTIAVANAYKSAGADGATHDYGEAHIFKASAWADDSTPDITLTSPETTKQLFFGRGLAIDGNDTLIVGQPEAAHFLDERSGDKADELVTGHGRSYAFDLAASDVQASAALLNDGAAECSTRTVDGEKTWTCPVDVRVTPDGGETQDPSITIPLGTPEGAFTISANLTLDGVRIADALKVTIDTVDEAHSASFNFATNTGDPLTSDDDKPYGNTIAAGGNTRMLLRILNANGMASAANSVSSVLFTTNAGTLSLVSPANAAVTNSCNGLTCQVDVSKLTAANSDKIILQLAHPGAGKAGTATVRAQVLSTTSGKQLPTTPVNVTFSGPVETIAIAEPTAGVLNMNTESGTGDDADDNETRDRLRLGVSAADKSGNKADTPTNLVRITITDPDGETVPESSIARSFPLQDADDKNILDANNNPQLELDVDALASAKLKSGEYTIELRTGGKTATQTFTVSGGAANIAISEPDGDLTVNGRFTLTATVTDADGVAVPDGTTISFDDKPTGVIPVLVNLSKGATTEDGQATATYLVISAGRGYVTATSGTANGVTLITTTAAVTTPTEPANPADSLSTRRVNAFSTWTGVGTTTASALLTDLDNGIDTILLWSNGAWLRYGISDGREIPGSMDFEVRRGAILWLGNGNGG